MFANNTDDGSDIDTDSENEQQKQEIIGNDLIAAPTTSRDERGMALAH